MRQVLIDVSINGLSVRVAVFVSKNWSIGDIKKAYSEINPQAVINVVDKEIHLDLFDL